MHALVYEECATRNKLRRFLLDRQLSRTLLLKHAIEIFNVTVAEVIGFLDLGYFQKCQKF
jgi:hypothetical protein